MLATFRSLLLSTLAFALLLQIAGLVRAESADSKDSKSHPRDISEILSAIVEDYKVPGMVAATLEGDRVVAIGAAGVRRKGGEEKITVGDKFHIGSCTKAMTATVAASLVADGKIRWTTTLEETFPDLSESMSPDWRGVTLEQLLTNRSGAPQNLDGGGLWTLLWQWAGPLPKQRVELLKRVATSEPDAKPGTKFIYSNAGFTIAGAMLEKASGQSWEDLMRTRLFEPLGITTAGFGAPGEKDKLDQPLGHRADGSVVELGPGSDNPRIIGPAGTVHMAVEDWAKFIALQLQGPHGRGKILTPELFKKLHTSASDDDDKYAMGWGVAERPWAGGEVLTHSGSNTMWFCVVWMAPKKDFAVLVCANQGGDKAAEACDQAAAALIQERESENGGME